IGWEKIYPALLSSVATEEERRIWWSRICEVRGMLTLEGKREFDNLVSIMIILIGVGLGVEEVHIILIGVGLGVEEVHVFPCRLWNVEIDTKV
uniref:Uncharacterized protein n=1 Tax=Cucumis melo TaxID=3656 RepID=A0A9I9E7N9_CUCME